jgi:hypothetical protein
VSPESYVDARPTLRALLNLGISRTRIARAVGCEGQTVLCFLFGLPMNVARRPEWHLRLSRFAIDISIQRIGDSSYFGVEPPVAAWASLMEGLRLLGHGRHTNSEPGAQ